MLSDITKIFNWLQDSGIVAATVTFAAVLYKAVYPWVKAHAKGKQQEALATAALSIVTKFATFAGLSKTDRNKAAVSELTKLASTLHITWVDDSVATSIVELAYQEFKKLNYDNHAVITSDTSEADSDAAANEESEAAVDGNEQKILTAAVTATTVADDSATELNELNAEVK